MVWAPDYITLSEAKADLRIGDTIDDAELAGKITAASRAVDDHTNRQFGLLAAPELWSYTAWGDTDRGRWVVEVDDFMTVVGLVVEVPGVGVTTQFTKEPVNAAAKGKPWTRLVFDADASVTPTRTNNYAVNVTARYGWTSVPEVAKEATRIQLRRLVSRRDSPYGVAGSPDQGSELRLLAKLDVDAVNVLRGYGRTRAVG